MRFVVRMPKENSSFFYFVLEGNDNLCFYSTLPHQTGDQFREVEVFAPIEWKAETTRLWDHLTPKLELEIKIAEEISDQKNDP